MIAVTSFPPLPALVRCTRTRCWAFGLGAPAGPDPAAVGLAVLAALLLNSCQLPFLAMPKPAISNARESDRASFTQIPFAPVGFFLLICIGCRCHHAHHQ